MRCRNYPTQPEAGERLRQLLAEARRMLAANQRLLDRLCGKRDADSLRLGAVAFDDRREQTG
jgi:hypothetical protein